MILRRTGKAGRWPGISPEGVRRARRGRLGLVDGVMAAVLVIYFALLIVDQGLAQSTVIGGWGVDAFELAAGGLCMLQGRRRRPGSPLPIVLGAAVMCWALGDIVLTVETLGGATPASPSPADAFYLGFFPLSYTAVFLLIRGETRRLASPSWLDGAVAGLGAAAVCAAFAFSALVHASRESVVATAVNLAYPIGDVLLLLLVAGAAAVMTGRRRAPWLLIAAGLAINVFGDTANLLHASVGGSALGVIVDAVAWPTSSLLIALSMGIAPGMIDPLAAQRPPGFVLPGLAAGAGLTILALSTVTAVNHVATTLATGALMVVVLRTWSSVRHLRAQSAERHRQSVTDHLTGLPNRRRLFDALEAFFAQPTSERPALAFLFIDLDGFKRINDAFGHPVGDDMLKQLSTTLVGTLRPGDLLARVGGDEFAVLLIDADGDEAGRLAERVSDSLDRPFVLGSVAARVTASIGIALAPDDAADTSDMMRCADAAMYRAKQEGVAHARYDRRLDSGGSKLRLADELRDALGRDDLLLHYQPQLDLRAGQIRTVEALVRWQHPEHGLIPPLRFLPLAEEAGLMGQVTHWVLVHALRQCSVWHAAGRHLRISVNISASDLADPGFPDMVAALLARECLDPSALTLEITETSIIKDFDRAQRAARRLTELGIAVSVDDFGAGFTSLAYLSDLAVHELKLDRRFITPLAGGVITRGSELVRATIALGHALGLSVVAEGVEDDTALTLLRDLGCDVAQGYGIGRPGGPDELSPQNCLSDRAASERRAPATGPIELPIGAR